MCCCVEAPQADENQWMSIYFLNWCFATQPDWRFWMPLFGNLIGNLEIRLEIDKFDWKSGNLTWNLDVWLIFVLCLEEKLRKIKKKWICRKKCNFRWNIVNKPDSDRINHAKVGHFIADISTFVINPCFFCAMRLKRLKNPH